MNQALTTILECFNEAEKMKAHALAAIVLDAGGRVKAFLKQDGASVMRFEIARGKAFAALAMHRSSRMVLQKARKSRYSWIRCASSRTAEFFSRPAAN